jgi:acetyl-CoA/propionyl-CoA carboxylase biotin carboxyl carrier protein
MTAELAPSEVARRLGTSTRTVQRWIATGRLPARRVGGRWRVASDAFGALEQPATAARPADEPIRTLFVANRGEIAERIRRTCERLGIRAVTPPTDGSGALDLLDAPAVIAAAAAAGADALHPGYGFLAESADFATQVEAAGIRWVGPPPDAIRAMGDKAAARRLAARLGVPVLPGYDGPAQDDGTLRRATQRVGFPLLVKPAAGGGGKGMRVVRSARELPDALAAARREAAAAFGDDRLLLERFIEGPRHVEIQVLFDRHGAGVHLGERDCSVQRRHQKVLEETPSPAMDPATRRRLGDAALRLAAAVGYVSAGTCEFLLDDAGDAWFLEMNTRLQVEHPVTEAVVGRDLVADQLAIAVGTSLASIGLDDQPRTDATIAAGGHAIEVRLYAEDAESGFLPATGRVELLRWPSGEGIRVDAGIERGTEVGGRFDPMLAKIIAHGRARAEALARLERALDETVVLGVVTNLRFLRWLVRQPWLAAGEARIDCLASKWRPGEGAATAPTPDDDAWALAGAAIARQSTPPSAGADPWSRPFRLNAPTPLRIEGDGGAVRTVSPAPAAPPAGSGDLALAVGADGTVHLDLEGRSVAFRLAPSPDVGRAAHAAVAHHAGRTATVVAPMPGRVIAVHVDLGAEVDPGDAIATLEAMKMEHTVVAPATGRITAIEVRAGDQVRRDGPIASIEA